jgi:type I restriction enzyme S subunit
MPANIGDNRVVEAGIARITAADARRLSRYLVQAGDIVYSRRGDVERRALITDAEDGWLCGTGCLRVRPGSGLVHSRFCSYFLGHPEIREWITRHAVGATMANLNTQILSAVPFLLPPLHEQRAIAHILGTLDDKIELNRRTNATLEAMAQALFKSWFVDFEPVRAKAEGRQAGLPDAVERLFPSSLVGSAVGDLPATWQVTTLQIEASLLTRGISPSYCESGGIPVINQKCIRDRQVDMSKARRHDPRTKAANGRVVCRFDTLVNSTGVGTLGRIAMMPTVDGEVTLDSHVTLVRGRDSAHSLYLAYDLMARQSEVEGLGEGSTGQTELSRARLGGLTVIMPPSHLLQAFFDQVGPLEDKRELLARGAATLTTLRDTLLPKLISGELRVPDAERTLQGVL